MNPSLNDKEKSFDNLYVNSNNLIPMPSIWDVSLFKVNSINVFVSFIFSRYSKSLKTSNLFFSKRRLTFNGILPYKSSISFEKLTILSNVFKLSIRLYKSIFSKSLDSNLLGIYPSTLITVLGFVSSSFLVPFCFS